MPDSRLQAALRQSLSGGRECRRLSFHHWRCYFRTASAGAAFCAVISCARSHWPLLERDCRRQARKSLPFCMRMCTCRVDDARGQYSSVLNFWRPSVGRCSNPCLPSSRILTSDWLRSNRSRQGSWRLECARQQTGIESRRPKSGCVFSSRLCSRC